MFGRERTRPVALKALTLLGVGAIVYSVVTFFGQPPRVSPVAVPRFVHVETHGHAHHTERHVDHGMHTSRARRPSLRPVRPTDDHRDADELPPRAGEIPVDAELASHQEPHDHVAAEAAAVEAPAEPAIEAAAAEAAESAASETEARVAVKAKDSTPPAAAEVAEEETVAAAEAVAVEQPAEAVAAPDRTRPEWVNALPGLNGSVYAVSVSSGPWSTVPECQRALEVAIVEATNDYIDEYLGQEQAYQLVDLPPSYLKNHIRKSEYSEVVESKSVGPMHQLHARLEFDDLARADFQRLWRNAVVTNRLWYTGGGAALVLALLATLYGYLQLDLRTGSAHKGRLQLAATLVALIVAASALLARWVVSF